MDGPSDSNASRIAKSGITSVQYRGPKQCPPHQTDFIRILGTKPIGTAAGSQLVEENSKLIHICRRRDGLAEHLLWTGRIQV